ncbi:hypothetical protein QFC21_006761 [Naganishia friedmannii]|uniref:Uncharacterized protein n=1 Tax=Naganishia friedmannii TaxID=89922 RepID=A0ACC2UZN2_9TREE|nr:hypothetical protein QFC21_006761 [Naganishia friedmannii]
MPANTDRSISNPPPGGWRAAISHLQHVDFNRYDGANASGDHSSEIEAESQDARHAVEDSPFETHCAKESTPGSELSSSSMISASTKRCAENAKEALGLPGGEATAEEIAGWREARQAWEQEIDEEVAQYERQVADLERAILLKRSAKFPTCETWVELSRIGNDPGSSAASERNDDTGFMTSDNGRDNHLLQAFLANSEHGDQTHLQTFVGIEQPFWPCRRI